MPKLKPGTIIPTHREDTEINAQIKADSDDFEWTEKIFCEAKPFESSDLPKSFKDKVRKERLKVKKPKILLSVRYSSDVVEFFKTSGKGWQTRMDEVLREYVASHR